MGENIISKLGFFLLTFVLYIGIVYVTRGSIYTFEKSTISKIVVLVVAAIYTLALFGYIQLFNPFCSEGYKYQKCDRSKGGCSGSDQAWAITPAKRCMGGSYMNQGDSPRATGCRELARTQEGRNDIGRYECNVGFNGMPGKRFEFTPLSNDQWKNERCKHPVECNAENNGIF